MAGRPSKLTPERRDDLTLMLAHGVPVGVAARSVEVSPRSVRRWLAEGDLRERVAELRSARRVEPDAISERSAGPADPESVGARLAGERLVVGEALAGTLGNVTVCLALPGSSLPECP